MVHVFKIVGMKADSVSCASFHGVSLSRTSVSFFTVILAPPGCAINHERGSNGDVEGKFCVETAQQQILITSLMRHASEMSWLELNLVCARRHFLSHAQAHVFTHA